MTEFLFRGVSLTLGRRPVGVTLFLLVQSFVGKTPEERNKDRVSISFGVFLLRSEEKVRPGEPRSQRNRSFTPQIESRYHEFDPRCLGIYKRSFSLGPLPLPLRLPSFFSSGRGSKQLVSRKIDKRATLRRLF